MTYRVIDPRGFSDALLHSVTLSLGFQVMETNSEHMPTSFPKDPKSIMSGPDSQLVQLVELHCLQERYST